MRLTVTMRIVNGMVWTVAFAHQCVPLPINRTASRKSTDVTRIANGTMAVVDLAPQVVSKPILVTETETRTAMYRHVSMIWDNEDVRASVKSR